MDEISESCTAARAAVWSTKRYCCVTPETSACSASRTSLSEASSFACVRRRFANVFALIEALKFRPHDDDMMSEFEPNWTPAKNCGLPCR